MNNRQCIANYTRYFVTYNRLQNMKLLLLSNKHCKFLGIKKRKKTVGTWNYKLEFDDFGCKAQSCTCPIKMFCNLQNALTTI